MDGIGIGDLSPPILREATGSILSGLCEWLIWLLVFVHSITFFEPFEYEWLINQNHSAPPTQLSTTVETTHQDLDKSK